MKNLNIFSRFGAIFCPNFLQILISEKKSGPTWRFWFFWTFIFSIIATIFLVIFINPFLNEGISVVKIKIEELNIGNFEIEIKDGELKTKNLEEPIFFEFEESGEDSVIVIDTLGQKYTEDILQNYSRGFFINSQKFVGKKNQFETRNFDFSKIQNFTITRDEIFDFFEELLPKIKIFLYLFLFVILWIFISLIHLLFAIFWAFIFWIAGLIFNIKNFSYGTSYLAVLNFYFIIFIIKIILSFLPFNFPFLSFILFSIVFGINFYHLKKIPLSKEA